MKNLKQVQLKSTEFRACFKSFSLENLLNSIKIFGISG
jgi:hypothetical protein